MYVILKSIQNVMVDGNVKRCYPGDWVDVGKSTALRWVSMGAARFPDNKVPEGWARGCGIVTTADESVLARLGLGDIATEKPGGDAAIPFPRTIFWDPDYPLVRPYLLAVGLAKLELWQVGAPLHSYTKLALEFGTEQDREATWKELGDLRVMVYDTRLLFVRDCLTTQGLLEAWEEEKRQAPESDLAFLRALNRTCPMILALPASWREG